MDVAYEWFQTNIVSILNSVVAEYSGDSLFFLVLFVSCISLLFLNKERMKLGLHLIIAYSALLLILVLLNPLVLTYYAGIKEAFVLLPAGMIIAYVITMKCADKTNRITAHITIILLTMLIAVIGFTYKEKVYIDAINLYKTDDQGIILADFIQKDFGEEAVSVCYILRDGEHQGDDISVSEAAIQYSGLIRAEAVPIYDLTTTGDADYLVISDEIADTGVADRFDYVMIMDTGYYTVFVKAQ